MQYSREMPGFACRPCGASLTLCLSSVFFFSLHILHHEINQLIGVATGAVGVVGIV